MLPCIIGPCNAVISVLANTGEFTTAVVKFGVEATLD